MSKRYQHILAGTFIADVAEGEAGEESGATYNYYGFLRTDGSWVILREKSDETEYRFTVGSDSYETGWDNRTSKTYQLASNFSKLP